MGAGGGGGDSVRAQLERHCRTIWGVFGMTLACQGATVGAMCHCLQTVLAGESEGGGGGEA